MIAWSAAPPCCGYLRSVPDIIEFFLVTQASVPDNWVFCCSLPPAALLHHYDITVIHALGFRD